MGYESPTGWRLTPLKDGCELDGPSGVRLVVKRDSALLSALRDLVGRLTDQPIRRLVRDPERDQLAAVLADQAEAAGALDLLALEIKRRLHHKPAGRVRGAGMSAETVGAIQRALGRAVNKPFPLREGSLSVDAWRDIAFELHEEGVDVHWHYERPDELRIYEELTPVARIVYDRNVRGLSVVALDGE